MFRSINRFQFLGIEDLPNELVIEDHAICVEVLQLETGDITMNEYLLSISKIVVTIKSEMVHC